MKKIKTVTFRFDRNDFPKKGEWYSAEGRFHQAGFDYTVGQYDIYTKTKTEEVWKPKAWEEFYYIDAFFKVVKVSWSNSSAFNSLFNIGNCFQTEAEAQAMADKFKELLKGN